jgi:hypothetical protein
MPQRTLPNLFIIGAMKSGTTTLHHAIGLHPEIFMLEFKEPRYFAGCQDIDLWWFGDHALPDPEGRWYFDMFSQAYDNPQIKYAGESSCDYTQRPIFEGCAQRIAAFNPESRILFIVRDPVDRCVAHYWHNVSVELETRLPIKAIWKDPRYIAFSDYALQIEPYLAAFPREQIHVLTLESLRNDQGGELRKIFEWLGVDTNYRIPKPIHANKSPEMTHQVRPVMLWLARFMISRRGRKTFRQLPTIFFKVAYNLSWRGIKRDAYDFEAIIESLRPMFVEKAQELPRLLGRDFPEWTITFPEGERTREASEVLWTEIT